MARLTQRIGACLGACVLASCIAWPSKEDSWCLPDARYHIHSHKTYLGMRCAW